MTVLLEVGPGIGTMTQYLAEAARACGGGGDRQKPDPDFDGYAVRL